MHNITYSNRSYLVLDDYPAICPFVMQWNISFTVGFWCLREKYSEHTQHDTDWIKNYHTTTKLKTKLCINILHYVKLHSRKRTGQHILFTSNLKPHSNIYFQSNQTISQVPLSEMKLKVSVSPSYQTNFRLIISRSDILSSKC